MLEEKQGGKCDWDRVSKGCWKEMGHGGDGAAHVGPCRSWSGLALDLSLYLTSGGRKATEP